MTPEIFAAAVQGEIIDENLKLYRTLFTSTPPEVQKDEHWQRALRLYRALDDEQQIAFFRVLRQVMLETVCNVFAVLDGATPVAGQQGTVSLVGSEGTRTLSGRLVEHLLELERDEAV